MKEVKKSACRDVYIWVSLRCSVLLALMSHNAGESTRHILHNTLPIPQKYPSSSHTADSTYIAQQPIAHSQCHCATHHNAAKTVLILNSSFHCTLFFLSVCSGQSRLRGNDANGHQPHCSLRSPDQLKNLLTCNMLHLR